MSGPLADPGLSALVLWAVLPVTAVASVACFLMWRARRGWVVLEGIVVSRPEPGDAATPIGIAVPQPDGTTRLAHLHMARPGGPPRVGAMLTLCHPPGHPEALQPGTPAPLLAAACAGALLSALCLAVAAGF
ncbi:hypothetical protein GXW74_22125 [Roseomonas eburnea]|uniref:Uncharacterized protein n=1 Tax=Neoroseomonas eburnea TaxID=1346889 RepID=A0A9X9XHL6_9PROT|nr:hypothetical protein [Neoroseomonas eburnea]MBR0683202.1 hypothetical protein [Neoroseomonas eburnea]